MAIAARLASAGAVQVGRREVGRRRQPATTSAPTKAVAMAFAGSE